jgi:hypothetical protein
MEHRLNDTERGTSNKTCPSVETSTTNPRWDIMGLKTVLLKEAGS